MSTSIVGLAAKQNTADSVSQAIGAAKISYFDGLCYRLWVNLLQIIESNSSGLFPAPERHVDGIWSRVYFCGDRVLKVYKHVNQHGIDLTTRDNRRGFYTDDFNWNKVVTPDIYLEIVGIDMSDTGCISAAPINEAHDFVIVMVRGDDTRSFARELEADNVSEAEVEVLTGQLVQASRHLTNQMQDGLQDIICVGWQSLFLNGIRDMDSYFEKAEGINTTEIKEMLQATFRLAGSCRHISEAGTPSLRAAIASQPENVLYYRQQPLLIDSMFPKRQWRVVDAQHNVARLALFLNVLGHPRLGEHAYNVYFSLTDDRISQEALLLYELRNALWQYAYRHIYKEFEAAAKFRDYSVRLLKQLH